MSSSQNKIIIVNTSALRSSGALAVYHQFIAHLQCYVGSHRWIIFVDPSVEQPIIDGVTYISDGNHSWRHRIAWEHGGLKRWLKKCICNRLLLNILQVISQKYGLNL